MKCQKCSCDIPKTIIVNGKKVRSGRKRKCCFACYPYCPKGQKPPMIGICKGCGSEFKKRVDGKTVTNRIYCFECHPKNQYKSKGIRCTKTKKCLKCSKEFPLKMIINNKIKSFGSRSFCFECSPFGAGNNRNLVKTEKKCQFCNSMKPLDDFYTRKNTNSRHAFCKKCTIEYNRERTAHKKLECVNYLGGACQRCGYSKCLAALDFHHIESDDKEYTIAHHKVPFNQIKKELDKCELLCSNCHREHHASVVHFDPNFTKRVIP